MLHQCCAYYYLGNTMEGIVQVFFEPHATHIIHGSHNDIFTLPEMQIQIM
jgi:hypothetical protein